MLESVEWGEYRLGDLFEILSSKKRFDANKIIIGDQGHPYVVRTSQNNGIRGLIKEEERFLNDANTISFGQDTATMYYQPIPYFTGDKIKILKPKIHQFNKGNAQFFISCLQKPFMSFAWGASSFNVKTIEKQTILLPTSKGEIDFEFMEKFIAELKALRIAELKAYLFVTGLKDYTLTPEEEQALQCFDSNHIEWGEYKMGELFRRRDTEKLFYKAKELPKEPKGEYTLPCLTSSFLNQGLNYYAPRKKATILKDVISIPSNSDVYRAYYQSRDFTVLSDAYAIEWAYGNKKMSREQYLFLVSSINQVTDLPIYSYKNKLGGWTVVKDKRISLPTLKGEIDYALMETLISAIQKMVIKDVVLYADREIEETKQVIEKGIK
ncbi:restriction endonuclease subunit S [Porphyromonas gingivalis]|uniref:restriction endonuclease subunit S n=1 Tax=Porphyromonas gingivalis TaxID=837 RepID=UPI000974F6E3|nr:restriction endonuclease subunit S [Porphyromonas gingivalis]SJL29800.1 Restriction enzyme BgcI subunit beta [Porphyromonas gingivalis]